MIITKLQINEALKRVKLPEKTESIIDLKLVKNVKIKGKKIEFDLLLAAQEHAEKILEECKKAIVAYLNTDVELHINFMASETAGSNSPLPMVKNIIAIASGKGGVGKSTISSNLAVALAKEGYKTGLLDADIFGPSIPKMFGTENDKPLGKKVGGKDIIIPVEKFGVKILSVGHFIKPEDATIWRGPMASNVLKQLLLNCDWGELDYLLIDLPPGTSDIHLTLVQSIPVTGTIIVSTPQAIALADAIKGINMFKAQSINVPILGIVENMAWFTPAELPDNKYYIFGKEGCKKLAEEKQIPLLGQIPLVQSIRENCDNGMPSNSDSKISFDAFYNLAIQVVEQVNQRNLNIPPTEIVDITN